MNSESGKLKSFFPKILVFLLVLFTAAAGFVFYQTNKNQPSGARLPSYSLTFEMRKKGDDGGLFSFVISCFVSDSGYSCAPHGQQTIVYPGLFSFVTITSEAASGSYHGLRVQINGASGNSFDVKSVTLQDRRIFDGKDYSVFKNAEGIRINRDNESGLAVFDIKSDSAYFDLDCGFTVESVPGTAGNYPTDMFYAVLFISAVLLLSLFAKQGQQAECSDPSGRCLKTASEWAQSDRASIRPSDSSGKDLIRRKSAAMRAALAVFLWAFLLAALSACGQVFLFNELSVSSDNKGSDSFMLEVSGSPDFSYSSGSANFYSIGATEIRIPKIFSSVRLTQTAGSSFMISSASGSCEMKSGIIDVTGDLSCRSDPEGRMYIDFSSTGNTAVSIALAALLGLVSCGAVCLAFRLIEFSTAVRLMTVFIMVAAYIAGEISMNVEFSNVIFYRNYLQLLPDVVLKNICLILLMFLLAELAYSLSKGFLLVLLMALVLIAIDWGVTMNFGVRADIMTMISHAGAGNSTFLTFIRAFFRSSHASWMVLVMLADWLVMILAVRRSDSCPLWKYLLMVFVLSCMPFLKVYENFYTESGYQLRKDMFDIQSDSWTNSKYVYTRSFPEYEWKPESRVIDGLNRRKNVVILMAESLADAYSKYFSGLRGYTPEIDLLAEKNASFLNYHSTGMETAPATYSVMTGKIFFSDLDKDSRDLDFEYAEALPKVMKSEGYVTSAVYSSEDFGGRVDIYKNSGFDHLYDTHDPAYEGQKRYVFNAVADSVLLNHAADLIEEFDRADSPHLTFILTTSSHTPYLNPETGKTGYREVIPYVDREIGKFVRRLESSGFFNNGMLVIVGDHHPPFTGFEPGELNKYGDDLNRVPLIIIDRDIGRRVFANVLGHDSLKSIIEYLNLKKVRKYDYQLIPFWKPDEDRSVTVLCPMLFQDHYLGGIRVSGPDGEQGVYDAKGDSSEFAGRFLSPELEKEVAGRVKWYKREE